MAPPRNSSVRLDSLWQQAREPAFWLTSDLRFAWVNRAWEGLTGHSAESVAGLAVRAHGPTRAGDLDGLAGSFYPPPEALAGHPSGGPTLIVASGGERIWRRVEFWPVHEERGGLLGLFGWVREPEAPPLVPDSDAHRLRVELLEVRGRLHDRYRFENLIGLGPSHRRLLDQIRAAVASPVPVLIVGESGTGKRLIGRTIHLQGPSPPPPLLPIDCAALPPEALERQLFGDGGGVIPLPEGSTLLMGDILDLPRDVQGRLASALGPRVRLLATTAGDPDAALKAERLRPDLYYALTTLVIRTRPLRERLDELPLLAQSLLERTNARGARQRGGFRPDALAALLAYDWPGNLRELARIVEAAHAEGGDDWIAVEDLPATIRGHLGAAYTPPPMPTRVTPLDELLTQVERRLIEQALQRARQNKSRAAELLGISRPRLYRRIKELNVPDVPDPAEDAAPQNEEAP
jgi:transcriptional regulator with AAA-type ATPase domain